MNFVIVVVAFMAIYLLLYLGFQAAKIVAPEWKNVQVTIQEEDGLHSIYLNDQHGMLTLVGTVPKDGGTIDITESLTVLQQTAVWETVKQEFGHDKYSEMLSPLPPSGAVVDVLA